jgi:hypothetical protein
VGQTWVCNSCQSVNRANDPRCYKCRAPRLPEDREVGLPKGTGRASSLPWALLAIACVVLLAFGIGTLAIFATRRSPGLTPSPPPAIAAAASAPSSSTFTDEPTLGPSPAFNVSVLAQNYLVIETQANYADNAAWANYGSALRLRSSAREESGAGR